MTYKGRYTPKNTQKYKGNPQRIIYRSSWERKMMVYCDTNKAILEWGSEEIIIPYLSPLDGRIHRYFPDFYIKVRQSNDTIKKFIIEVKPKNQCAPPNESRKKTRRWYKEAKAWGINSAKWKYATEWCAYNDMEFKILTEDHLSISYK